MKNRSIAACLFVVFSFIALPQSAEPERFEAADSNGVEAWREGNTLTLKIDADKSGPVTIPRLAAPLRSMQWQDSDTDDGITLKPEQETWTISWKNRPEGTERLVIQFDAPPRLPSEIESISASVDGSFYLPAHLAITEGEKIRYEPQTFKNTVGYWVGNNNTASWTIQLDKPGRFNVAILQGCGKGQGGSQVGIAFYDKELPYQSLNYEVVETGHFQNFRWQHVGEVQLDEAGKVKVVVAPQAIKKNALMDVRAVHLIRLPD